MDYDQLRIMVANTGEDYWDLDSEMPDGRYRSQVKLHELLWSEGDERRALGIRFETYLHTLLDASAFAFVGVVSLLNEHVRSNGRLLFKINEENLARLLHFYFHGTRDPDDVMFRGVSDRSLTLPRARIPSWMESTLMERRLAQALRKAIDKNTDKNTCRVFEFITGHRLEATGLNRDTLPQASEVLLEARARKRQEQTGHRGDFRRPSWSVSPTPALARALDRLYDLFSGFSVGSLESRVLAIHEAIVDVTNELHASVEAALARARTLRAKAQQSHGDHAAGQLAEAAEARAKRLALLEWCAEAYVTFLSPLFSVPDIVLDSETMRCILSALGVEVPDAGKSQTAKLDLFEHVFRIREYLAEAGAGGGGKVKFGGVVDTGSKYAYVHCTSTAGRTGHRETSSQNRGNSGTGAGAGAPPGSAGGGRKTGSKKGHNKKRR